MNLNVNELYDQAIRESIRSHILNETRRRNTIPSGRNYLFSVSSRYYNDPPRGGYQVNEEHEYIFPEDIDDLASLVFLDVTTRFGSPVTNEIEIKNQRKLKIKQIKYHKVKNESETECPICLENLKTNEYQRTLDCKHCFHKKCIDRWFKKDNDCCPMCRATIIN